MSIPHIPVLRLGRSYESLEHYKVKDHRTGDAKAVVSLIHSGIIKRDLHNIAASRAALNKFTVAQLIKMSAQAGELFLNSTLPLGDQGHTQSPQEYVETAVQLAGDLDRMQRLRATLRDRMKASPLLDADGFTRNLEAAYRQMWTRWCVERPG